MSHPTSVAADSQYIWMDGKLVPYHEAVVPVLSHSLHYGCAVFEGIRSYETARGEASLFRATEHFQRFFDSMKAFEYKTPFTALDLLNATAETIKANGFKECYVRPLAYMDDSVRGLKIPADPKARIAIAVWKWGKYMGDDGHKNGVRVAISSFRRPDVSSGMTWAKLSGNYLTSVLSRRESTKHGFDECLLLDQNGFIAEGSGENIFVVKNKIVYTPPTGFILPGITRDSVMQMARDLGYTIREENITRNQIYLADEVFFTGTAVEVTPIREIDSYVIGDGKPGPITKSLADLFFKVVRGEASKYQHWLTTV